VYYYTVLQESCQLPAKIFYKFTKLRFLTGLTFVKSVKYGKQIKKLAKLELTNRHIRAIMQSRNSKGAADMVRGAFSFIFEKLYSVLPIRKE
jgi:hypothetical protein